MTGSGTGGGWFGIPFIRSFRDLVLVALAILLLPPPYQWPAGIKRARKALRGALRSVRIPPKG